MAHNNLYIMSIRSIFFETSNSPRACLKWIIVIVAALVFVLLSSTSYNLKTDGPTIQLTRQAVMTQRFDKDTIKQVLPAGDSIRVLAIDRSSFGQKWLVQSSKGERGWIDAAQLPQIRQVVTKGKFEGDTVTICGTGSGATSKYVFKNSAGEEDDRSTKDFIPVLKDWDDYAYNSDGVVGVCSMKKFKSKTEGKNMVEVDKALGSPIQVHSTPQGLEASYSWKVFDPTTGTMQLPTVTFSSDSIATGVTYSEWTSRASSWLKRVPMASTIIDWPLTSVMVRDSRYNAMSDPTMSGWKRAGALLMIPIILLAGFIMMFMAQTLPVLLMGWLVKFAPVFAFLSDRWLKLLMAVVAGICAYSWCVMMMAWGMFPFWCVLIWYMTWYCFLLASSPLCRPAKLRCPKCHRLYTIDFDHRVFEYDEIKKGKDIVFNRLLGTRTEKWKAWTEVTTITTYRDGHKTEKTTKKDEHTMARDHNEYEFIDYEVTYRLDHYRNYFKCSKCDYVEESTDVEFTELDRKVTGTHTEEGAGNEYRLD